MRAMWGRAGAGMPLRILARLLDTLWIVLCAIGAVVIAVIWLAIAGDPGSPQEWLRAAAKISFGGVLLRIVASLSYQIALGIPRCRQSGQDSFRSTSGRRKVEGNHTQRLYH